MPKIPAVSSTQAVRVFEKLGYRVIRQGKHIVMSDGKGEDRIIFATQRNHMHSLDAETDELIDGFGDGGALDLIRPYRPQVNRD